MAQTVFKPVAQNQTMMFPPSLDEMIDKNHPVRTVNEVIDRIKLDSIYDEYVGGGTSSYSPRMLLKVLVYSYMTNIYSSRGIESAIKEQLPLMWLSGMNFPDHNTICRFRSLKLKDKINQIFPQIVLLLHEAGLLDIRELYTDGTKLEANANRYSFVWGRNIPKRKEKIMTQLNELADYVEGVVQSEVLDVRPTNYDEINPTSISEAVNKIDEALKKNPKKFDSKVKQKVNRVKKAWPNALERYAKDSEILGERNSYSKTDKDATFMRLKEDHMKNGQLKPAYNIQLSVNNQYILATSVHSSATDTNVMIPHIEHYKSLYGFAPQIITADAGYGSEENYKYAEQNGITAYVKYNYFHKEQKKKWIGDISKSDNLHYNKELDCFYCPMGQKMTRIGEKKANTATGFEQTRTLYQAQNCNGCPLRGACHKSNRNRIIEVNHNLRRFKAIARERLNSDIGITKRKRRPIEPESVFGNIKHNKKFKRFLLRGKEKVEIELGLVCIAHNLAKFAR